MGTRGARGSNQYVCSGSSSAASTRGEHAGLAASVAADEVLSEADLEEIAFAFHPAGLGWVDLDDADAQARDFDEILIRTSRPLGFDDARRMSGCIGYAVRALMGGEGLSEPEMVAPTLWVYRYDSTRRVRTSTPLSQVFAAAETYASEGTPIRKRDQARRVEGVGTIELRAQVR